MSAEARPGNVDTSSLDQFRSDDFFAGEELLVSRDEVPRQEIEMFAAIEEIFPQIPDKFKPALKTMMELVPAKFLERSLAMLNRVAAFENWQRFGKPVLPGAAEVARDLGAKVGEAYDQAARESKDLFFLVEELRNFLKRLMIVQLVIELEQLEAQREEYKQAVAVTEEGDARGQLMEERKQDSILGFREQLDEIELQIEEKEEQLQNLMEVQELAGDAGEVMIYSASQIAPQELDPSKAIPVSPMMAAA